VRIIGNRCGAGGKGGFAGSQSPEGNWGKELQGFFGGGGGFQIGHLSFV
jgi:hypothetical protein